jgi:hypothetical protein
MTDDKSAAAKTSRDSSSSMASSSRTRTTHTRMRRNGRASTGVVETLRRNVGVLVCIIVLFAQVVVWALEMVNKIWAHYLSITLHSLQSS